MSLKGEIGASFSKAGILQLSADQPRTGTRCGRALYILPLDLAPRGHLGIPKDPSGTSQTGSFGRGFTVGFGPTLASLLDMTFSIWHVLPDHLK